MKNGIFVKSNDFNSKTNIGEMIFLAKIMGLTSGLLHILLASGNLNLNSCRSNKQFSNTNSGAKFAAKIPTLLPLIITSKEIQYSCTSNGKTLLCSLSSANQCFVQAILAVLKPCYVCCFHSQVITTQSSANDCHLKLLKKP